MGERKRKMREEEAAPVEEIAEQDTEVLHGLGEYILSLEDFTLAEYGNERPLAHIEDGLNEHIIGQSAPISSLITALSREKIRNPKRPTGVFMFLGPTGVGKSELAKELSFLLHGNEDAILKIDCSNYSENHRVSALIGAAPEYVGREQKPVFDKRKIERPRSIILFDEIEKGCPALFDLLLNVLEDGEITLLNGGQKISFRNSIIIFTSNIGAPQMRDLLNPNRLGFNDKPKANITRKELEAVANKALKDGNKFRPEFLNRIDEKIVFNSLDDNELGQILDINVDRANKFYEKEGLHLTLTPELRNELIASTPERYEYGARPILRKYEKLVEGLMAKIAASGGIPKGSHVYAALADKAQGDTTIEERIRLYHRADPVRFPKLIAKNTIAPSSEQEVARAGEAPTALNDKNKLAIGAIAAAGIVSLLVGDYLSSRRATKSRRAW